MLFHASSRREEEAAKPDDDAVSKGGLLGTGINSWYALPVGIAAAVPALQYEWLVINEETQLTACFIMFLVACYTQGGDAVYKYLDSHAEAMLKEQNEAEDDLIAAYEEKLKVLNMNANMVNTFEEINALREVTYANLNKAGKVKPSYDFKTQMERTLNMIIQEEASVEEKAKAALMAEATDVVANEFYGSKELQKAALDAAIARLQGTGGKGDPVLKAYQTFFKQKAEAAKKSDDGSEEKAQRAALVAKLNAVAKNEGFFFSFGPDGTPKMNA